jgi:long-chain-fatty-acid--CoA ligase ACSBG
MLSQDSVAWSAKTIAKKLLTMAPSNGEFRVVSFLPLNHVAGQMMDILGPLYISSQKGRYVTLFFPAMCYLRKTCSIETLADTRPVTFLGVPEVWDGLKLKLEQKSKQGIGKIAPWSVILKAIGLDKVKYAVSGAGPVKPDTISFFQKIGINILNMFAQSESSALGTAWTNEDFKTKGIGEKFGSIGRELGNELKLDKSLDEYGKPRDEIMLKGRNVMLGYLNRPDKTEETIKDGWLMTGDKGTIDSDGFVFLTGRLKEIMKIQGEMIAPVAVEQGILRSCNPPGKTILKQVIVVGDGKQHISVLITLLEEIKDDKMGIPRPTGQLAGDARTVSESGSVEAARNSDAWAAHLNECIGAYNKVAQKSQEKVRHYWILPRDITAEDSPDLMTPTFKIKREAVNKKYENEIDKCFSELATDLPGCRNF